MFKDSWQQEIVYLSAASKFLFAVKLIEIQAVKMRVSVKIYQLILNTVMFVLFYQTGTVAGQTVM